jgi:hypothetical protein
LRKTANETLDLELGTLRRYGRTGDWSKFFNKRSSRDTRIEIALDSPGEPKRRFQPCGQALKRPCFIRPDTETIFEEHTVEL